jgi:pimeloyl-ACP methyl ester carboxylesterase
MFTAIKDFFTIFKPAPLLHVAVDLANGQPETIVMLHGIAASSETWRPVIARLDSEKYRVIALDLLGFGDSPKPADCQYTVEDHVRSIRRTLKRLKIRTPIQLMGHSMGSIIAMRYYHEYPRAITAIHLLSPPIYSKKDLANRNFTTLQTDLYFEFYRFLSVNKDFTLTASRHIRRVLRLKDGADVTEGTWESFRLSLINTIVNQHTYEDIRQAKVPVYITYGAMDEFLIAKNIDTLQRYTHVHITKLQAVNHTVGARFASKVTQQLH